MSLRRSHGARWGRVLGISGVALGVALALSAACEGIASARATFVVNRVEAPQDVLCTRHLDWIKIAEPECRLRAAPIESTGRDAAPRE